MFKYFTQMAELTILYLFFAGVFIFWQLFF
jgi:hypothetical protein